MVIELSTEAMYNCQSIIGKIRRHPNIEYIVVTGSKPSGQAIHPCLGLYSSDPEFHEVRGALSILSKKSDSKKERPSPLSPGRDGIEYPDLYLFKSYTIAVFEISENTDLKFETYPVRTGTPKNLVFITYNF